MSLRQQQVKRERSVPLLRRIQVMPPHRSYTLPNYTIPIRATILMFKGAMTRINGSTVKEIQ